LSFFAFLFLASLLAIFYSQDVTITGSEIIRRDVFLLVTMGVAGCRGGRHWVSGPRPSRAMARA